MSDLIKFDQTKFFDKDKGTRGNCFQASLAMALQLPIWIVPDITEMPEAEWMDLLKQWLTMIGRDWRLFCEEPPPPGTLYIANGPADRGVRHSVVMLDGNIFHDPHPSRSGLLSIDSTWWFPCLNEAGK